MIFYAFVVIFLSLENSVSIVKKVKIILCTNLCNFENQIASNKVNIDDLEKIASKIPSTLQKIKEAAEQTRNEVRNLLEEGKPSLGKSEINIPELPEYKTVEVTIGITKKKKKI